MLAVDQRHAIWAQCDREGADLGSLLVAGGYAFDAVWQSAGWYGEYEEMALAKHAGLWAGDFTIDKTQSEEETP